MNTEADLENNFVENIYNIEKYKYRQNGGHVNTSTFWCCQRSRKDEHGNDIKRLRDSKRCHNCTGTISIVYTFNKLTIKLKHMMHNELYVAPHKLSADAKIQIYELSKGGLTPFQILGTLRATLNKVFIYNQVYNTWIDSISSRFRLDVNPIKSLKMYLENSQELNFVLEQNNPFENCIVPNIGKHILNNWYVKECLIDSTFKTNKQRYELFAVIITCLGVGFPLAYFSLEPGRGNGLKSREESITAFLQSIANLFPSLKPSFFMTDEEVAQIKYIYNVFRIAPSICLWHLKRAIKKISESKKKKESYLSDFEITEVLQLIDSH